MSKRSIYIGLACMMIGFSSGSALAQPSGAPSTSAAAAPTQWYHECNRLNSVAIERMAARDLQAAQEALDKSIAIAEANKSNDYIDLALGFYLMLHRERRDVVKAEAIFKRRLALAEEKTGFLHSMLAVRLWEFGDFYRNLGQYDRSEAMLLRAMAIFEQGGAGGSELNYARAMMSLAEVHRLKGRHNEAEEMLKKAVARLNSQPMIDKGAVSAALSTLAIIMHQRGDFDGAIDQFKRACTMVINPNPWELPASAQCSHNLGLAYISKGDYPAAKIELEKASAIWTKSMGADHPHMTYSLSAFAQMYDAMGDADKALFYLEQSADIADRDLEHLGFLFSEAQKRDFVARLNRQRQTEGILSFATATGSGRPGALQLALRTVLRRKGRVLDAMVGNSRFLREAKTPEERQLFKDLLETRAELSRLLLGGAMLPEQQKKLIELKSKLNQMEDEIARRSIVYRNEMKPISVEQVKQAIPEGALLIEIAKYRPYNRKWRTVAEAWMPARYAAFLVAHSGEPELVDLGEAASLDDLVAQYRKAISGSGGDSTMARIQILARNLDDRIFRPIEAKGRPLANPSMIFISPDGWLNTLPFGALLDKNNRFRIESYPIVYLTAGRDLLKLKEPKSIRAGKPLLLANPAFGEPPAQPKNNAAPSSRDAIQMRFPALPGTEQEAMAIQPLIPGAVLLKEANAKESALRSEHSPILLHIATHGFFLDEEMAGSAQSRGLELAMAPPPQNPSAPSKTADSPASPPELSLGRSGLAFAGANRLSQGSDDGLLTALEAASLDLSGTELVVLSACETGLGGVGEGEGIYGLRRALTIAGARSQVMTLWKVDDLATRDLMIEFYQGLASGKDREKALRDAQISLLRRQSTSHPYFWASFIHSGAGGPILFEPEPEPVPPKSPPPSANPIKMAPVSRGCGCEVAGARRDQSDEVVGASGFGFLGIAAILHRMFSRPRRKER